MPFHHFSDPLLHAFPVRSFPVDPLTTGTPGELLLGGKNVGRYQMSNVFRLDDYQPLIAAKAEREPLFTIQLQLKMFGHLPQLIERNIIFDEQKLTTGYFPGQPGIPGKNDSTLQPDALDHFFRADSTLIGCIVSEHAQIHRQLSQHPIGQESHCRISFI